MTGANAGLGKECARQLALKDGVDRVILACRNEEKATAAKNNLEQSTQKQVHEILIVDVSNLDSVRKAVNNIQEPIDGLVLNAGGIGGKEPTKVTSDGVTDIVATNLLGHALMVDLLLEQKKLVPGSTVVYSGSEAARGVMGAPQLKTDGSVQEFVSLCNGKYYANKRSYNIYGDTKLMAALWMASMARKYPEIRFVTMSPGATTGTSIYQTAPLLRVIMTPVLSIMQVFHKAHNVETGAKRYVDALYDESSYQTGVFYASANGISGDVCDQARFIDYLDKESYQDHCNEAIHTFLR